MDYSQHSKKNEEWDGRGSSINEHVEQRDGLIKKHINKKDDDEEQINEHGLTTFSAAITIISECIGAGMVSLPIAYLRLGVVTTLFLLAYAVARVSSSTYLLLKTKDLIPGKPESFFEMGYILVGRSSIFIMSFTLFSYCTLLCIAYFFLFGGIVSSLIQLTDINEGSFIASNQFSVLILAVLLLPIIFLKEIHELKIVAWLLFAFLLVFLIIMFALAVHHEPGHFILPTAVDDPTKHHHEIVTFGMQMLPIVDLGFKGAISSINTASFSLSITSNIFPTYASLKHKTTKNMLHSLLLGLAMTIGVYTLYSIVCMTLFGRNLLESEGNSLENIGDNMVNDWSGLTLQILFLVVLAAHIPFMFFVGKESLLIILDELDRRSVSETLNKRMDYYKQIHGAQFPVERKTSRALSRHRSAHTEVAKVDSVDDQNKKIVEIDPQRLTSFMHSQGPVRLTEATNQIKKSSSQQTARTMSFQAPEKIVKKYAPVRETQTLRCSTGFGVPIIKINDQQGTQEIDNKLAYKDMKASYYVLGTLFYFALCVVGGMYVPNVEVVINWTSSIQIVIIGYLSPGIFYNLARKQYPQNVDLQRDRFLVCQSYMQYVLAFVTFVLGMTVNVLAMIPEEGGEDSQ